MAIITIDGPAGVGKSSVALSLASELAIPNLDTGAMFRFAALKLGDKALDWPEGKLTEAMQALQFNLENSNGEWVLSCNGEKAGSQLRNEEIGNLASRLANLPTVREELRKAQRKIGEKHSLIAEGRDMGSVVFPNAELKIFLDASPAIRAKRRYLQLTEKGQKPNLGELEKAIMERDERDRSRKIAPLKAAPGAIVIDTGNLNLGEVLEKIRRLIETKKRDDPAFIL